MLKFWKGKIGFSFGGLEIPVFFIFLYTISLIESGFFPLSRGIIAPRGLGFILR